jgi:hypothetical protein
VGSGARACPPDAPTLRTLAYPSPSSCVLLTAVGRAPCSSVCLAKVSVEDTKHGRGVLAVNRGQQTVCVVVGMRVHMGVYTWGVYVCVHVYMCVV